ncbi:MAG: hypothetical protein ACRDY1_13785 [Acidimicrobiales bacterium]
MTDDSRHDPGQAAASGPDLPDLRDLPPTFAATRASLHLVAARILGAARFAAVGRLGLVVVPGGFGTPEFDGRRLLVVDGQLSDGSRRQPITTLLDAGAFAGVDPTVSPHPVLDLPGDPTAPLPVDPAAAAALATWLETSQTLLTALTDAGAGADDPSSLQLWPEHFDLALESGPEGSRANYGASPGDETIDQPYLYVGPHEKRHGSFWNAPFGAALPYSAIRAGEDPEAFLRSGREHLRHL